MEKLYKIAEYFKDVETTDEHNGYFCNVGEALAIAILGTFCGLRNVKQIHQWASNERIARFLAEKFGINRVPCYYWLLCLINLIDPKALNECFIRWVESLIPEGVKGYTLSIDGKTIRSTGKMDKYAAPLHIVSAHIAELGITFGQQTVCDKSNEIPAVRELIGILNIEGCIVVADALNCQKETAKTIIERKADYLLNVKANHGDLKDDIETYVQDEALRQEMDTAETLEENRGRTERRIAFATQDISWLHNGNEWVNLACIGAINRIVTTSKGTTNEWHYFISSRNLTAEELLSHVRLEWSVESMHWLLDVHFGEDFCRVLSKDGQQNLNIVRKIVLNHVRRYKESHNVNRPFSNIMLDCLIDPYNLFLLFVNDEN
jgi:predicted transposase YbfD/YdcC